MKLEEAGTKEQSTPEDSNTCDSGAKKVTTTAVHEGKKLEKFPA